MIMFGRGTQNCAWTPKQSYDPVLHRITKYEFIGGERCGRNAEKLKMNLVSLKPELFDSLNSQLFLVHLMALITTSRTA